LEQVGKTLMVAGLVIAAIGLLMWLGWFKWLRLGRLPGDIAIQRYGFSMYIPLTSMLLVSIVLTLVFWVVGVLRR
jgi:hypothetical protein